MLPAKALVFGNASVPVICNFEARSPHTSSAVIVHMFPFVVFSFSYSEYIYGLID